MTAAKFAPLESHTDRLLAEIAGKIQLSPRRHRMAVSRYAALADWLERDGSPLKGRVALLYPQGSMAIGATILSRDSQDRFDIDIAVELDYPADALPQAMLDRLYGAVNGQPGSQYFGMALRRSRCVTVKFAEMHLDLTPMVRRPGTPEKESWIFENRKETPQSGRRLVANPHGFSEWFNGKTHRAGDPFAAAFFNLAKSYDARESEQEPVPDYERSENKSQPVIVLQLLKQWRNVQYQRREDQGPPSILLSRIVAEVSNPARPLGDDLALTAAQSAQFLRRELFPGGQIANPVCQADILTDRWPGNGAQVEVFVNKLLDFSGKIRRLNDGCSISEAQKIMGELFGEHPTREAVNRYGAALGQAIQSGRMSHAVGTAAPLPPVGAGAAAAAGNRRAAHPTPRHQFHKPPGF